MKRWIYALITLLPLAIWGCYEASSGITQEEDTPRLFHIDDTTYELPYVLPKEQDIVEVLERIYQQIHGATRYRVIDANTGQAITDFSEPIESATVDIDHGSYNLWDYTVGVIHTGMFAVGEVLSDARFSEYPIKNYDFIFDHLPYFRKRAEKYHVGKGTYHRIIEMDALDHCGSIGAALIQAYQYKQRSDYAAMIDTVEQYIMKRQFRLDDGTLARERPQKESVWADDFYMSIPFLARMGAYSNDEKYFDEAVKQVVQMSSYLFDWDKQIFDHGWNKCAGDYDPRFYWGRANGWAMMAMATLLDELPEQHVGRDTVLSIFRAHVQGVTELQGGNGLWHNLLNRVDTYSETSCSAMFVYSIAKGVNEKWIDHTYGAVAQAGWNGLTMYVTEDGRIENMCAGTTFSPDLVYYYHRPSSHTSLHGFGPMLLAGSEMIKLLRNPDLYEIKQWRTFHYRKNEYPNETL